MVSKLTFKGSKKSSKSNKLTQNGQVSKPNGTTKRSTGIAIREEDLVMVNNKLVDYHTLDPESLEAGWSTANTLGDLNGPCILIPLPEEEDSEEKAKAMAITHDDKITISTDLDLDGSSVINFNGYLDDSVYQRTTPKHSSQVFVLNNILKLIGSKKELQDSKLNQSETVKLTLKSKNGYYLNGSGEDLSCDSGVLTGNEVFEFTRVRDETTGKIRWRIQSGDQDNKRKLYLMPSGKFKMVEDEEDLLEQLFVVRVQIQNTVGAKKIKLLRSEESK